MPPIQVQFGGDPAKLLQAYNQIYAANVKLQQQYQQLANQQQQHAQQGARQHSQSTTYFESQIGALKGMAAGYFTVTKAINFVVQAQREKSDRLKEIAARYKEVNTELLKNISLSTEAAAIPQLVKSLKSVPGVSTSDAAAAYLGVTRGTTSRDVKANTELGIAISEIGKAVPDSDLASWGELAGHTKDLVPGMNAQQIRDLVVDIRQKLGPGFERFQASRSFPKINQLVKSGTFESTEDALGWAVEAANANPELIGQMLEGAVNRRYERPRATPGMSREEHDARVALWKAKPGAERRAIIESNPMAASIAGVEGLDQFNAGRAASNAESFRVGGDFGEMLRAFSSTREGRQLQADDDRKLAAAKANEKWQIEADELKAARELLATQLQKEGAGAIRSKYLKERFEFDLGLSEWGVPAEPTWYGVQRTGIAGALHHASPQAMAEFVKERNRVEGYQRYTPEGALTSEAIHRLIEGQREQTEEIRRGNDARLQGPAPVRTNNEN